MSDGEHLVVEGTEVLVVRTGNSLRVVCGDEPIGSLELAGDGTSFVARRPSGNAVTRPSAWGGAVTAQFGSRELAVRALLNLPEHGGDDG